MARQEKAKQTEVALAEAARDPYMTAGCTDAEKVSGNA